MDLLAVVTRMWMWMWKCEGRRKKNVKGQRIRSDPILQKKPPKSYKNKNAKEGNISHMVGRFPTHDRFQIQVPLTKWHWGRLYNMKLIPFYNI